MGKIWPAAIFIDTFFLLEDRNTHLFIVVCGCFHVTATAASIVMMFRLMMNQIYNGGPMQLYLLLTLYFTLFKNTLLCLHNNEIV